MTEAELARLESYAQPEAGAPGAAVEALASEVRRLRGLVTSGGYCLHCCPHCAWCGYGPADIDDAALREKVWHDEAPLRHDAECPAFNEDGSVK